TQEIAGWVGVRDSKLGPNSPVLTVTAQQWSALCAELPTMPAEATIGPVRICTAEETTTYSRGPVRTVWHWQHRDTGVELHYTAGERDAFLAGLEADEFTLNAGLATAR
ncbi:MAG: DUF397 domain-containing protein, partial [Sciscionella sp.]